MQSVMRCSILFVLTLMTIHLSASAQESATARLSGRVVDPAGAVVVRARVVATHKSTAAPTETKTSNDGVYTLSNLAPGEYEVRVQKSGFKTTLLLSLTLQVGQS